MTPAEREAICRKNHELVKGLKPDAVFTFFADLSGIPRGSGNVSAVADFLEKFAADRAGWLTAFRDDTGNVIIRKKAQHSKATETVILQAHQDMVCVKTSKSPHDFLTDPIELVLQKEDGKPDLLMARDTTLGADDGIGVAIALAILDNPKIPHPPLEALFTVDEETDMKGVKNLDPKKLKGTILINLDAEDLNIAYVSSAAGVSFQITLPIAAAERSPGAVYRTIKVSGLLGGHSGIEINKSRANAYVLLARFLNAVSAGLAYFLHTFERGEEGGADNAICDRAMALLSLSSEDDAAKLDALAQEWTAIFQNEYRSSEKNQGEVKIQVAVESAPDKETCQAPMTEESVSVLLSFIRLLPLGVFRFVQADDLVDKPYGELLVETSCNLGMISRREEAMVLKLLARGSTETVLTDLMARIEALSHIAGGKLEITNHTQGWEMPAEPSRVQQLFKEEGFTLMGVHAGLECGCLVDAFKKEKNVTLDAISIGPDMKEVHSPKERLSIDTVQILWNQLTRVLKKLS